MRKVEEIDIYVNGELALEGATLNYESFDMASEDGAGEYRHRFSTH